LSEAARRDFAAFFLLLYTFVRLEAVWTLTPIKVFFSSLRAPSAVYPRLANHGPLRLPLSRLGSSFFFLSVPRAACWIDLLGFTGSDCLSFVLFSFDYGCVCFARLPFHLFCWGCAFLYLPASAFLFSSLRSPLIDRPAFFSCFPGRHLF